MPRRGKEAKVQKGTRHFHLRCPGYIYSCHAPLVKAKEHGIKWCKLRAGTVKASPLPTNKGEGYKASLCLLFCKGTVQGKALYVRDAHAPSGL